MSRTEYSIPTGIAQLEKWANGFDHGVGEYFVAEITHVAAVALQALDVVIVYNGLMQIIDRYSAGSNNLQGCGVVVVDTSHL